MQNKLLRFLFLALAFLIILQLFSRNDNARVNQNDDVLITSKGKFTIGKEVVVEITNQSSSPLTIENPCPANPMKVEWYENGEWIKKESVLADESVCANQPKPLAEILAGKKAKISFDPWNRELFGQPGRYRISYETVLGEKQKVFFHEIAVAEPSFLLRLWNTLLYKPIFNTLIFLVSKLPGHSLGWGIVLLTVLIKLILLGPNQKALKSQRAMQVIQPQLEALKLKYKNDPQRLAQETMAIWKKHKVSPMGSCLPMLIQFPILIALFYVVRDGLSVSDPSLFYPSLKSFSPQGVNPVFLGLIDLTKINWLVMPIIVGGLQFFQIRLSQPKVKSDQAAPAANMMKMVQWIMPVMIGFFTASLPAAVGFYWGVSTLFGIGQQWVVNSMKD